MTLNPFLLKVAHDELPEAIAAVRGAFTDAHPQEPVPMDEEIMAALNVAFQFTVDKLERPEAT